MTESKWTQISLRTWINAACIELQKGNEDGADAILREFVEFIQEKLGETEG